MSARILAVDDNRANLDLMLYLLGAFGYECDAAADGVGGLERARNARYDAALVDILMPGMDGYEFARLFKSDPNLSSVPLIAVTALAMPGDDERIAQAGFDGYIPKPIDPERFVQQVEGFLRHGKGATAPRHAQTPASAAVTTATPGPIILAVDDLQTNLDVVRAALVPLGYRVAEARSVSEALQLLQDVRPDLIICDLHMPGEGGFELIQRVNASEQWRAIPFVFLSSTAWQTKDRRRGIELGARKFILRPIDPERLRREIDELIADGKDPRR
ncbi:MAG: response regulator [Candidatus Tyrphobacter sp.]